MQEESRPMRLGSDVSKASTIGSTRSLPDVGNTRQTPQAASHSAAATNSVDAIPRPPSGSIRSNDSGSGGPPQPRGRRWSTQGVDVGPLSGSGGRYRTLADGGEPTSEPRSSRREGSAKSQSSEQRSPRQPRKPPLPSVSLRRESTVNFHSPRGPQAVKSPRAVIAQEAPELAEAPASALIMAMDSQRRKAEAEGRYEDAQEFLDRIRAITLEESRLAERKIREKGELSEQARAVAEQNRRQLFQFTEMWETTMRDYNSKSERLITETQERHHREFEEAEELLRSDLANKKPHFSRNVLRLRQSLERLVTLQHYKEAEGYRKDLVAAEEKETIRFEEQLSLKFAVKTKELKKRFATEMAALKQRCANGREELVSQRRVDYHNLLQRHANSVQEAKQKTQTAVSVELKGLQRQVKAVLNSHKKKTIPGLT